MSERKSFTPLDFKQAWHLQGTNGHFSRELIKNTVIVLIVSLEGDSKHAEGS